jgi:prepilin-type N-terminal cleavage/methylation domain-containing protein
MKMNYPAASQGVSKARQQHETISKQASGYGPAGQSKKMNMMNHNGFTLIEVIVTLVVAAILGTLLVSLMGTNLTKSALPISLVGNQYKIVQAMETITSRYREEIKNGTLNLNTFKAAYVDTNTYVDGPATGFITLTSTGGTPYTTQQVLRVTLRSGDQSVQTFFTQ